ncbi:MAG: hypothetical protein HXS54_10860 [Theionarchaea archaeon]|nr:hypothetical protein [Theionarchaea archaeon]
MNSRKDWERDYRTIYDTFWENPRCSDSTISGILGAKIAAARLKMAYELRYIVGPEIRKKAFRNLKEYMYFIKSRQPERLYMKFREDSNVIYHAKTSGFCNLWVIAKEKMDIKGEIILEGYRSDYYASYAPGHMWDKAIGAMRKKVDAFNLNTYNPQHILGNHFDETIDWDEEDKLLYRYFKYDLRKPFTPLAKEGLSKEKTENFLNNLPNTCTIHTSYYPDALSSYDPYLFMFETDHENFIINLFSELPSSVSFFKVSNMLFLSTYIPRELARGADLQLSNKLYIPLLMVDLLERSVIRNKDYAIVEYSKGKDI